MKITTICIYISVNCYICWSYCLRTTSMAPISKHNQVKLVNTPRVMGFASSLHAIYRWVEVWLLLCLGWCWVCLMQWIAIKTMFVTLHITVWDSLPSFLFSPCIETLSNWSLENERMMCAIIVFNQYFNNITFIWSMCDSNNDFTGLIKLFLWECVTLSWSNKYAQGILQVNSNYCEY